MQTNTVRRIRKIQNIDDVIKTFNTDDEFMDYVRKVYKENEDANLYPSQIHWLPENIQQAKEYIEEWCTDLILTEQIK